MFRTSARIFRWAQTTSSPDRRAVRHIDLVRAARLVMRWRSGAAALRGVWRSRILLLLTFAAEVAGLTGVMVTLGQASFEESASQSQADLERRALRGAQELSQTLALGLATSDTTSFNRA